MANLKVSQEVDLGLVGIDGSVEYRVIKGSNTYKQSYADLFSYINSNVPIPDLQQVLTAGNTTTNDNLYIGLVSGGQTGVSNVGIGVGALAGVSGGGTVGYSVGIGEYAGQSDNFSGVAIGYFAGQNMSSGSVGVTAIGQNAFRTAKAINGIAIGQSAGYGQENVGTGNPTYDTINIGVDAGRTAQGDYTIFIGTSAGFGSTDSYNIGIGYQSQQGSEGTDIIAIGQAAAYENQGSNDVVAIGNNAAFQNVYSNVVAIGLGALSSALAGEIVAIGTNAFANAAIGINSTDNIGIGNLAGSNSGGVSNIFIGSNAGESSQAGRIIAIGEGAAQTNTGRNVTAIGLNAGAGNPINGQFILSNETFPSFSDDVSAIVYYSTQGLPTGNSYLYYDEFNNVVRAYRT